MFFLKPILWLQLVNTSHLLENIIQIYRFLSNAYFVRYLINFVFLEFFRKPFSPLKLSKFQLKLGRNQDAIMVICLLCSQRLSLSFGFAVIDEWPLWMVLSSFLLVVDLPTTSDRMALYFLLVIFSLRELGSYNFKVHEYCMSKIILYPLIYLYLIHIYIVETEFY